MTTTSTLERARLCRLDPELALTSLEEAEAWIRERGVVVVTAGTGSLPSLHGACHEPPYMAGSRGFGSWPKTKWRWSFELPKRPGLVLAKILRGGRAVFLAGDALAAADPLCRAELARAQAGEYGEAAARALEVLAQIGPALPDELGLTKAERGRLERAGVLVGRGGPFEPREFLRWDHAVPRPSGDGGEAALFAAAVRAAVVAPEAEARRWFPFEAPVEELVAAGVLHSSHGALTYAGRKSGMRPVSRS